MSRYKLVLCLAFLAVSSCHWGLVRADVTDPLEVSSLIAIKSSLIDPQNKLQNWGSGDPCRSKWKGVICYNSTLSDGFLHVHELQLMKMSLSGNLASELGHLSYMKILDFMWNNISGSIPKDIGNITSLELLLLSGNQLSGSLPEELGNLSNLKRLQIDQNLITGPIPKSFAHLNKTQHFHMNNNSLTGLIPTELSTLPELIHLLLDNNNLTGPLPPELSKMPKLLILQLDNNNFSGSSIPVSYGSMIQLVKLSLRNCTLQGSIPDLSAIQQLGYVDLSWNQLTGPIPSSRLSNNITTIDFSHNFLNGSLSNFSGLPNLQKLSVANNSLIGSVPSNIWQSIVFTGNRSLILDFRSNSLTNLSGSLNPPANVTIMLYGNPVCASANQLKIVQFCQSGLMEISGNSADNNVSNTSCGACSTDLDYEYNPSSPIQCYCYVPLGVGYRLKSPGFTDFRPYYYDFERYLTDQLLLAFYQLQIESFIWEKGPRLRMDLKLFPNNIDRFNCSEVKRIYSMFTGFAIPDSDLFGPYELLNFTLGSYEYLCPDSSNTSLSTGAIVGIVLGAVAVAATLTAVVTTIIIKRHLRYQKVSRKHHSSGLAIKIDGVRSFTFKELAEATNNFSGSFEVGQGGYGTVYRGTVADGTVVAIKRAKHGSLQGSEEFSTELQLLSRLHHRNLVSLLGYCDEEDEQMLVYEFMPNGSLRDHLSSKSKEPLSFSARLRMALGSSRGILYLHTEANPPVFHRDIKASNILLDSKFIAKVADFGLSHLAPVPDIEGTAPGHVSTVVKGTPGYLDPEYFLTQKLTDKSDVYSLGVVFLELLTGMQVIYMGKNIVRQANIAYQAGDLFSIVDTRMGSYPPECIKKFAALAFRCCKDDPDARPSMKEVVSELESIWQMTPEAYATTSESVVTGDGLITIPPLHINSQNPYRSSDTGFGTSPLSVMSDLPPR